MDLVLQKLILTASGAGFVLLCESEYLCWKLFKRKISIFFFTCQLAILSSAIATIFSLVISISSLQTLPVLVIIALIDFVIVISYPMMILLRLRIICRIHSIIMCMPIIHATVWAILRYFEIKWYLTHNDYYYHTFYIIRPIFSSTLYIQNIIINVFFIILSNNKFRNLIHVRNVIIINIIVILIECTLLVTEFIYPSIWSGIGIFYQIIVRLELSVLDYIIEPHRRPDIVVMSFM